MHAVDDHSLDLIKSNSNTSL